MKKHNMMRPILTALVVATLCGCGDDTDPNEVRIRLAVEAEESITDGIPAGEGDEAILDGWAVDFDAYLLAMGDIDLQFATDPTDSARDPQAFVVDLVQVPPGGLSLWEVPGLQTGRWEVGYRQVVASESMRHESVTEADYDAMVAEGCTYLLRGSMSRADGRSCPPASLATPPPGAIADADGCYPMTSVAFEFCAEAAVRFGPCGAEDGPSGVAIPSSGSATAALSIHGDHVFFNGFPEGDEGSIMRLAQWLADCDLDLDGQVSRAELEAIAPSDLAELDARYDLSAPFEDLPLDTMWNYLRAQLRTQGHFQGEGECPVEP